MFCKLYRVALIAAALLNGAIAVAAQDALLPLQAGDIEPGTGCTFSRFAAKGEGPIFRWVSEGRKQAVIRTADGAYKLEFRQEKHIPERDVPHPADRLVLYTAGPDWQVQVLGNVVGKPCYGGQISGKAKAASCKGVHYEGRLLVQYKGGARTEHGIDGYCDN